MLKYNSIQVGDYVVANNQGDTVLGEVVRLNPYNKQVCIDTGPQNFWYDISEIAPIALSEAALQEFKFHKQVNPDGSVKYSKGAFRVLLPKENDFSRMEIWYREEHRHIAQPIFVHELQNHFHEMTKVYLNDIPFD